ncbi:glycerol ether metabolic process [Coemansia nantahalensis]|uniref:Glycerol ether metabolic process n=2 Tax=Coemansia TaxID=4863 RepID=A0ACC1KXP8_9FUNG|nr:glycerol ether metabolic process [Coemansia nantahalensis]KAJ2771523.1 glycerol ether metabolic process [Coemansia nantahalensis]KAJ2797261.1 glycerol ether metabolic process [Coemansia helicoidea]
MSKSNFIEIESKEQFDKIVADNALVAIDFTATWCGPCKLIGPVFKAFSQEFKDIVFLKVDVDDYSEISQKYEVRAMPTFKFLLNGKPVDELVGANKAKLNEGLQALAKLAPANKAKPEAAPEAEPEVEATPAGEAAPAA